MRRGASSPGVPLRSSFVEAKPPTSGNATWPARLALVCAGSTHGVRPFAGLFPLQVSRCFHRPGPACRWLQPLFPIVFIGPAAAQRHKVRLAATGEQSNLASGLILSVVRIRRFQKAEPYGRARPFLPWAFPPSGLSERDGRFARTQVSGPFHLLHRTLARWMSRSARGFAASFPQTVFCGPRR